MSVTVAVHVDLPDGRTVEAGRLDAETNTGGALVSTLFCYADAWLSDPAGYALCPELPLGRTPVRLTGYRVLPGAVADTGPDRWGRKLLFAAERAAAVREHRHLPTFTDIDFVLGVDDRTRVGNLRFTAPGGGPFLAPPRDDVPSLVDLPRLVDAAARQQAEVPTDADLRLLVAAGTSMGGARPKVGTRLDDGTLALVKLPERDDRWDVEAWEATTLDLARRSGLRVPRFTHRRLTVDTSALVVERFDRDGQVRVGFMSAATLLAVVPGEVVSYVELAEALGDLTDDPVTERGELFDRVAFTLLVNNVDDHLKNHALLRSRTGWRLSPVFDVNPFPAHFPVESTPVTPTGPRTGRSLTELVDVSGVFGLGSDAAVARIVRIEQATRGWLPVAESFGIEDPADSLATAFVHDNRRLAQQWAG
ncbi:MAG: HipA domain-containing protein [Micrococcales bacterium]|nr:HipA domain-containing protein [Micrococcales bacterium]